jgi:hypothetical protein
MISADDERAALKVRAPMAHGEDQPDEFSFVRGERRMAVGELSAEEHATGPSTTPIRCPRQKHRTPL